MSVSPRRDLDFATVDLASMVNNCELEVKTEILDRGTFVH